MKIFVRSTHALSFKRIKHVKGCKTNEDDRGNRELLFLCFSDDLTV